MTTRTETSKEVIHTIEQSDPRLGMHEIDQIHLGGAVTRVIEAKPGLVFSDLYQETLDFTNVLQKVLLDLEEAGVIDAEGDALNPRYFLAIGGRP